MRAMRYHKAGEPDVLQLDDIERPIPGPGELLVKIWAASVNPVDAKRRARGAGRLPKTTGSDFAGTVAGVGSDIENFAEGDRVFGTGLHADRFQQGSFADYVTVPTDVVAELPESVSFEEGATIALVGVTAWRAVIDRARLSPAETCFIHGGSGGVGHVAVQLAALSGGLVIATAGSDRARERVRELGADRVFAYDRDDLRSTILKAHPEGVDVVVDHRVDDYLSLDIATAAVGARIVVFGGREASIQNALTPRSKELTMHWMSMSNLVMQKGALPRLSSILSELAVLIDRDRLTVEIADSYELTEAAAAHRAVLEDSFVGKLVISP